METSERFALNEWLSEFPDDKTFDEIMDLIRTYDESVIAWELVEHYPAADLIELIYNTQMHFEFVTKPSKDEQKHHADCPAVDGFGCRCNEYKEKSNA